MSSPRVTGGPEGAPGTYWFPVQKLSFVKGKTSSGTWCSPEETCEGEKAGKWPRRKGKEPREGGRDRITWRKLNLNYYQIRLGNHCLLGWVSCKLTMCTSQTCCQNLRDQRKMYESNV